MSFNPKININKTKNIYNANIKFDTNCFRYFPFENNLDNFVNSTKAKEKILIDINKYTILLINIKISTKNNNNPVLILLYNSDFI